MSDSFQQRPQTRSSKRQDSFVPSPVQTRLTRYVLEGKLSMSCIFSQLLACLPPSLWRSERSCQKVPHAAGHRARAEACGRGSRMLTAAGCCPGTSQGAVYLGALPSRRPPALEVQKPAFAGTPGRDPSVRRTLPLTQITRPKYKPR